MALRIDGYVIVSADGMLANAQNVMPDELRFEGDKRFFTAALERADLIVHVFDDDTRRFYGLERLWYRAPRVDVPGVAFAMPQSTALEALLLEEG